MFKKSTQWHIEQISANHLHFSGQVDIEGEQTRFFADDVDLYTDTNRLVASGNVVFASPEGRISAERVDFNTQTGTGIFYQASGIMSLGPATDRGPFGNQDPDVYFYGEQLEKLGSRKYRVTRGGFTTCVQPTPRWEVTSNSVVLNLNEYAVSRNTVLRVKGVPIMYLPVLYYPIKDGDRTTGILLPTYGASTLRGHSISNAFFWAIDRSQDATFFYDWFTRTGQGAGTEYRYVAGPQSNGNFRFYRFGGEQATYTESGQTTILPANTSFELAGTAIQTFGPATRARVRLEYFSDIQTQQLYHQNIYQATQGSRIIEAGLSRTNGPLATGFSYQRNETFNGSASSVVYGGTPRITANLAPQRLFDLPLYGSLNSEYARLPYQYLTNGVVTLDNGLTRVDLAPTLRAPLSRLTFLSINSNATYRMTYYTRSLDALGRLLPEPFRRQYLQFRSDLIGPTLTRIWDLPGNHVAERLKHVIEPTFSMDYTSAIDDYQSVPVLSDASDFVVGGAAKYTYGLNNRLFYRARTVDGVRGQTREFVTVGIQQTYYTKPEASQYDTSYGSSYRGRKPVELSPVALNLRVSPNAAIDANARFEYDVSGGGLQIFTAGSNLNHGRSSAGMNFSRRHLLTTSKPDDYLNANTSMRFANGRVIGNYSLSWDIGRAYVVSQRIMASYMAQCCGLEFDFQKYNYPAGSGFPIPADHRLNFSFVLAGLGTFSNFFGAFTQR